MSDILFFGYFDSPNEPPAYDPGLNVPCIYCRQPLSAPMRAISLMVPGDSKSYFYRVHKACSEKMEDEGTATDYDGIIIDAVFAKNANPRPSVFPE